MLIRHQENSSRAIGDGSTGMGHGQDAFASMVEALPTDGRLLAQLAQSEAQLGDYANAERHFVEAWEIQPNSVSIARGYATLLVQIGKKQAAAEVLVEPSISGKPDNIALRG